MIYIFNSAFKPTYMQNVYRLIGLPTHTRVDMRYTAAKNGPALETDLYFKNAPCIICYVDRFASDYLYYPIRKGKIRNISREQERVYYKVELLDFCHSDDPSMFTQFVRDSAPSSPRLIDHDRESSNDGIYCLKGAEPGGQVTTADDSWAKAANQLSTTKAFAPTSPVFYQSSIGLDSSPAKGSHGGLELHANVEYKLHLQYLMPESYSDDCERRIEVRMGSEINRTLPVGSPSDRLEFPFTLPPLDFSAGEIEITTMSRCEKTAEGKARYTASIPFRTSAWRSNLLLFGALLVIAFLSEMHKVDFDLSDSAAWISTILEFSKFGIIVWAVFKYRGKLKLPGL